MVRLHSRNMLAAYDRLFPDSRTPIPSTTV